MEELREKFNNYLKCNGTTIKFVSTKLQIPYDSLQSFKTGRRNLPQKYINRLTKYIDTEEVEI